jgi:hypothetical protein
MGPTSAASTADTLPNPGSALLCPACGYDLRGSTSDQCSECGLIIDREALKQTAVPWAHRRAVGWLGSFFRTVWQFTVDAPPLRPEPARPQDLRSARRFRWILAMLLAAGGIAYFALAIAMSDGFEELAVQPPNPWAPGPVVHGWLQDLFVPWSAGATLPPVLPLCILIWAFFITGAGAALARRREPEPQAAAARTLLLYASAPLVWVAVGLLVSAAILFLAGAEVGNDLSEDVPFAIIVANGILWIVLTAGGILLTFLRTAQWTMRLTHGGFGTALLAAARLLGLWAYASLLCFGLLPWTLGYLWIAIDSLLP